MNRRPWLGITGRREAIRPYVDTSKSVLGARPQVLRRGGERVSAALAPALNCQNFRKKAAAFFRRERGGGFEIKVVTNRPKTTRIGI